MSSSVSLFQNTAELCRAIEDNLDQDGTDIFDTFLFDEDDFEDNPIKICRDETSVDDSQSTEKTSKECLTTNPSLAIHGNAIDHFKDSGKCNVLHAETTKAGHRTSRLKQKANKLIRSKTYSSVRRVSSSDKPKATKTSFHEESIDVHPVLSNAHTEMEDNGGPMSDFSVAVDPIEGGVGNTPWESTEAGLFDSSKEQALQFVITNVRSLGNKEIFSNEINTAVPEPSELPLQKPINMFKTLHVVPNISKEVTGPQKSKGKIENQKLSKKSVPPKLIPFTPSTSVPYMANHNTIVKPNLLGQTSTEVNTEDILDHISPLNNVQEDTQHPFDSDLEIIEIKPETEAMNINCTNKTPQTHGSWVSLLNLHNRPKDVLSATKIDSSILLFESIFKKPECYTTRDFIMQLRKLANNKEFSPFRKCYINCLIKEIEEKPLDLPVASYYIQDVKEIFTINFDKHAFTYLEASMGFVLGMCLLCLEMQKNCQFLRFLNHLVVDHVAHLPHVNRRPCSTKIKNILEKMKKNFRYMRNFGSDLLSYNIETSLTENISFDDNDENITKKKRTKFKETNTSSKNTSFKKELYHQSVIASNENPESIATTKETNKGKTSKSNLVYYEIIDSGSHATDEKDKKATNQKGTERKKTKISVGKACVIVEPQHHPNGPSVSELEENILSCSRCTSFRKKSNLKPFLWHVLLIHFPRGSCCETKLASTKVFLNIVKRNFCLFLFLVKRKSPNRFMNFLRNELVCPKAQGPLKKIKAALERALYCELQGGKSICLSDICYCSMTDAVATIEQTVGTLFEERMHCQTCVCFKRSSLSNAFSEYMFHLVSEHFPWGSSCKDRAATVAATLNVLKIVNSRYPSTEIHGKRQLLWQSLATILASCRNEPDKDNAQLFKEYLAVCLVNIDREFNKEECGIDLYCVCHKKAAKKEKRTSSNASKDVRSSCLKTATRPLELGASCKSNIQEVQGPSTSTGDANSQNLLESRSSSNRRERTVVANSEVIRESSQRCETKAPTSITSLSVNGPNKNLILEEFGDTSLGPDVDLTRSFAGNLSSQNDEIHRTRSPIYRKYTDGKSKDEQIMDIEEDTEKLGKTLKKCGKQSSFFRKRKRVIEAEQRTEVQGTKTISDKNKDAEDSNADCKRAKVPDGGLVETADVERPLGFNFVSGTRFTVENHCLRMIRDFLSNQCHFAMSRKHILASFAARSSITTVDISLLEKILQEGERARGSEPLLNWANSFLDSYFQHQSRYPPKVISGPSHRHMQISRLKKYSGLRGLGRWKYGKSQYNEILSCRVVLDKLSLERARSQRIRLSAESCSILNLTQKEQRDSSRSSVEIMSNIIDFIVRNVCS